MYHKSIFLKYLVFFFFLIGVCLTAIHAQIIPLGDLRSMDARNEQLMHGTDSLRSFVVRPSELVKEGKQSFYAFKLLPVYLINQYNSHHPFGYNDGSMIAAKGIQSQISMGLYAKAGPLEAQIQPELVYAANPVYESNAAYGYSNGKAYKKLFAGQSSISLSASAFSVGVSTANIWWGPGIHSSLIMSNNAPGFAHVFIKTKRPVNTPIGTFEFELIGGRLTNDTALGFENFHLKSRPGLNTKWRYLNGYVLSYHPKWVPGLYLGIIRGIQQYGDAIKTRSGSFSSKWLPILVKPVQKINAIGDDTLNTDQVASFFLRMVFPKAKAEFYAEYGYNDYGANFRDYLVSPTHSTAYTVGFKKLVPLQKEKYLDLGVELIQLSESPDAIIRSAGNWYEHGQITQGLTNDNQILGSGAGFAANNLVLTANYVNGYSKQGLIIERTERDPEYHSVNWTDFSIGYTRQIQYQNYLIGAVLQYIHSANYMWEQNLNKGNIHFKIAVQYYFDKLLKK